MEKGFHNIEQFIAFITPGHTAFHERLSIKASRMTAIKMNTTVEK